MNATADPLAAPAPRAVDSLLARYGESHRHPSNKSIHWICVPIITWTVFALLWALHPVVAVAAAGLSLVYYLRLSPPLALGMAALFAGILSLASVVPHLAAVAGAVFALAWIGQFIGHAIEGKKPSFFEDMFFLLIGPFWLLSFVYRKLAIRY